MNQEITAELRTSIDIILWSLPWSFAISDKHLFDNDDMLSVQEVETVQMKISYKKMLNL